MQFYNGLTFDSNFLKCATVKRETLKIKQSYVRLGRRYGGSHFWSGFFVNHIFIKQMNIGNEILL